MTDGGLSDAPQRQAEFTALYHEARTKKPSTARGRQPGAVHLHTTRAVTLRAVVGRSGTLTLHAGQCLCKRSAWRERPAAGEETQCTKCVQLAERYGIPWPETARTHPGPGLRRDADQITNARPTEQSLLGTERTMTTAGEEDPRFEAIGRELEATWDQLSTARASAARAGIFRSLVTNFKDFAEVVMALPEDKRTWASEASIAIIPDVLRSLAEIEEARLSGNARRHVLAPHIEQTVGGIFDRMVEIPADSVTGLTALLGELQAHTTPGSPLADAEGLLEDLVYQHEKLEHSAA